MKQIEMTKSDGSDEENVSISTTLSGRTFLNDSLSMQPSENSSLSSRQSTESTDLSAKKLKSEPEKFLPEQSNINEQPREIVEQHPSNESDTKLISEAEKFLPEQSNINKQPCQIAEHHQSKDLMINVISFNKTILGLMSHLL